MVTVEENDRSLKQCVVSVVVVKKSIHCSGLKSQNAENGVKYLC